MRMRDRAAFPVPKRIYGNNNTDRQSQLACAQHLRERASES